jgi:predicted lactoylglutathione lyase
MRMIFLNLPVKDVEASKRFFCSLGFGFNPQFSDDNCACLVVEENIFIMLLSRERFSEFINGDVADAEEVTEVLTCLSVDSRDAVEDLLHKALAAGGKPWKPVRDEGNMYGCSFQDIDGHVWEMMYIQEPT